MNGYVNPPPRWLVLIATGLVLVALAALAHAGTKIDALPAGTTLGGTEPIPAVQSATTVRTTPAAIATYTTGVLTSANVISKWSGTCNSGVFLRGDGACSNTLAALTLTTLSGVTGVTGGAVHLQAGTATAGTGGDMTVSSTPGVGLNRNGGALNLLAGDGGGGNSTGGSIMIQAGIGNGNNTGGNVSLFSGNGGPGGAGGTLSFNGGVGGATSGDGGGFALNGGIAIGVGNGGALALNGGDGGFTSGNGGSITLNAGQAPVSGTNGTIILKAGGTDIMTLDSQPTTGARTATFSATNKPGAGTGAPVLWLKVIVPGTTCATACWVPLFAN